MKKFIAWTLVLVLCLGMFAGCAEKPVESTPAGTTAGAVETNDGLEKAAKYFPVHGVPLAANRLGEAFPIVVEKAAAMKSNPLLCECEMVSRAEIEYVAADPASQNLTDVRLRTRLGMGTCQGTYCSLRTIGALTECKTPFAMSPADNLRDFLQERWKGLRPALWGLQAREMELGRAVYAATLNIDGAKNEQKN